VAGNWKRRGDARCIHRVVDIAGVMPKGGRTAGGQTYGAAEPQRKGSSFHHGSIGIERLNALSAQLFDHADSITNVAAHQMEVDIRLAAQACDKLAGLRFRLGEIAEIALHQNVATTARDLRDAVDNAARMA
jgi:hypothetical protein